MVPARSHEKEVSGNKNASAFESHSRTQTELDGAPPASSGASLKDVCFCCFTAAIVAGIGVMFGMLSMDIPNANSPISLWSRYKEHLLAGVAFLSVLRFLAHALFFKPVLEMLYQNRDAKRARYFCEWIFEFVDSFGRVLLGVGLLWLDASWFPRSYTVSSWFWIPELGSMWLDSTTGEALPPSEAAAIFIVYEIAADLHCLVYDIAFGKNGLATKNRKHGASPNWEILFHHVAALGACFWCFCAGATRAAALVVLLIQAIDACEFAAIMCMAFGSHFLVNYCIPLLEALWSILVLYVFPACTLQGFALEQVPPEMQISQTGMTILTSVFWILHVFWLWEGRRFISRNLIARNVVSKNKQAPKTC